MTRTEGTPTNNSITRAALVLGLFSAEEPELVLGEIGQRLGLNKATAHRYVTALRRSGLIRYSGDGYALGPRVIELAAAALAGLDVVKLAGPFLDGLVAEVSQTVVLSVWDRDAPVVVRTNDNTGRSVRIQVATGSRLPADSSQAQVFRAFLGEERDPLLDAIRRDGYVLADNFESGIGALAAPVWQGGEVAATIAIVGTSPAIQADAEAKVAALLAATSAFSAALGS